MECGSTGFGAAEFCESEAELDAKFDAAEFGALDLAMAEFCAKEFCGVAERKTAASSCEARFSADEVEFSATFRRGLSPLSARLAAAIFL